MAAFRVAGRAFRDLFDELFALIAGNVIWAILTLPLLVFAIGLATTGAIFPAALLALLAVIPAAPASVGLTLMGQQAYEGMAVRWHTIFRGFREYATWAWRVYGIWAGVLLVLLVSLAFYRDLAGLFGVVLTTLVLYAIAIWCIQLIYLGPLMILQEKRNLRQLYRNSFVLTFSRPLFTLITAFLMLIIVTLSIIANLLPLIIVSGGLLATWSFRAVAKLVLDDEARQNPDGEEDTPPPAEPGRRGQVRPR